MLQDVLNLTNDAGRKFINAWIINGPKCWGAQNIIKNELWVKIFFKHKEVGHIDELGSLLVQD